MSNKPSIKIVWGDPHQNKYNRLYNGLDNEKTIYYKNTDKDTYLNKMNNNELMKQLKGLQLVDSSNETFFFTVARYYESNKINNTSISVYKNERYAIKT